MTAPSQGYTRILSIDGGGIRGIIPGEILVALEKKLQTASGNPGARIADHFDLIAGTSTGGILACALLCPDADDPTRPRYTAEEAVALYLEHGQEIFDISVWQSIASLGGLADEKHSAASLEKMLRRYFDGVRLSHLLRASLVTAYDIEERRAHFFTSHSAKSSPDKDFELWKVARATSAAPTFFEAARVESVAGTPFPLVDGGVFANNPALCAFAEARKLTAAAGLPHDKPTTGQMVLLSLGTGQAAKPYPWAEAKDWGLLGWARPVIDIMMSGVAETVDYQLRQIFDAVNRPDQYLRIDPQLGTVGHDLDNASEDNLCALSDLGKSTAHQYSSLLDVIVQQLV